MNLTAGDAVMPSKTAKTGKAFVAEVEKVTMGLTCKVLSVRVYLCVQQFSVNITLKKTKIDWFMVNMPS